MASPSGELPAAVKLWVLERNRIIDPALFAVIPIGLGLFTLFLLGRFELGALGVHLAAIALVTRYLVRRNNLGARMMSRVVRATPEGLTIDGVLLPRRRIAGGFFQPRSARSDRETTTRGEPASTVRLLDRRKSIVFEAEVSTERQAVDLLRALGLDAGHRRAEFTGSSPLGTSFARTLIVTIGAILATGLCGAAVAAFFPAVDTPLLMLLVPVLMVLGLSPSKIVVGIDGILVRWLSHRRFIPMAEVAAVHRDGTNVIRLRMIDGRDERIHTSRHQQRDTGDTHHRDAVHARIVEALASHRERGPTADVATLVSCGGRTAAAWKEALALLQRGEEAYRRAAIREEDLWHVVEDPRAAEDARAAAAVLLRRKLDVDGKARVRIAADATASPRLRIALSAAAGESDEAANAALDDLVPAPKRLRA